MKRHIGPPGQSWWTFLRNHMPEIAAKDLFVVRTLAFNLLYGFIILRLGSRLPVSFLGILAGAFALPSLAKGQRAAELRVAIQYGLSYLPLMIIEQEKLLAETYLSAAVGTVLALAYTGIVAFAVPGARPPYSTLYLAVVIFCINGLGFSLAALTPLVHRYAAIGRFYERHGRRNGNLFEI